MSLALWLAKGLRDSQYEAQHGEQMVQSQLGQLLAQGIRPEEGYDPMDRGEGLGGFLRQQFTAPRLDYSRFELPEPPGQHQFVTLPDGSVGSFDRETGMVTRAEGFEAPDLPGGPLGTWRTAKRADGSTFLYNDVTAEVQETGGAVGQHQTGRFRHELRPDGSMLVTDTATGEHEVITGAVAAEEDQPFDITEAFRWQQTLMGMLSDPEIARTMSDEDRKMARNMLSQVQVIIGREIGRLGMSPDEIIDDVLQEDEEKEPGWFRRGIRHLRQRYKQEEAAEEGLVREELNRARREGWGIPGITREPPGERRPATVRDWEPEAPADTGTPTEQAMRRLGEATEDTSIPMDHAMVQRLRRAYEALEKTMGNPDSPAHQRNLEAAEALLDELYGRR